MVYVDASVPSDLNHKFPVFEQLSRVTNEEEGIRENVFVKELVTEPPCGTVHTIYECIQRGSTISETGKFLGEIVDGAYNWVDYKTAIEDAEILGSAMLAQGLKPQDRVGIAGIQSTRFIIAMHGMVSYSMTIVPLYHNSKLDHLCHIINNCELSLIFVDGTERCLQIIEKKRSNDLKCLKTIVLLPDVDVPTTGSEFVQIISYSDFYETGKANRSQPIPPSKDDVYLICHTSGTTGTPKGVMLTHGNLLAASSGLYLQWVPSPNRFHFDSKDIYFSFLSLAHVYEHLMQAFIIYIGGSIGIYNGNITQLVANIQLLRPTIISLVPRLLNKFHDHIHAEVNKKNVLSKTIFQMAKTQKLKLLSKGIQRYDTIWDKIVFNKLRPLFGGKLRMITTGGAPVTSAVKNFTRIAYGCPLVEGYGQTECAAAATLSLPFEHEPGVVGGPAPWSQVKLVDVPELQYFAKDNKGEICFRGAAVMKGYYGDEELTKKTIDDEGWLHTGDIGHWKENGSLAVIDRKNALFKMAQGDFVSPEQIEAIYMNSSLITQILVIGETTRSFLVGIAVANISAIKTALNMRNEFSKQKDLTDVELINDTAVAQFVLQELNAVGKEHGLQTIEIIKHLKLTLKEWTAEDNLVTPTLKLRRHLLREKFQEDIEELFAMETTF